LVLITALAAGLRLYRLEAASFWIDELKTVNDCTTLWDMHKSKLLGYVPTAVGLWLCGANPADLPTDGPESWRSLGVNEWSARIGSAVVGIVSVPLIGLAGIRLLGARGATILMLLLAVAPWHIYWSQAARFYTLQFLFYSLALIWYFVGTEHGARVRLFLAFVMLTLAFLSQPPALVLGLVFAVDWLWGLASRRAVHLGLVGWASAVGCLIVCVLILYLDVARTPDQWTQFAGDLYQSPGKMILGVTYMVGPALVLFAALVVPSQWPTNRRRTLLLALAAVVPALVFAFLSLRSYVGLRYAFVCLFGWLALGAVGVDVMYEQLRTRAGRWLAVAPAGLLLTSMMLMNYGYYTSGFGFHERWRDGFEYVKAHRRPADLVTCPYPIIAHYYMEDAGILETPRSLDELRALDRPAWIVREAEDVIHGSNRDWIEETTELRAYFDVRVLQPYSSMRVYRYAPPLP